MKIYITHCSAKKENSLKGTSKKVFPDELYTAKPTQRFMNKCKQTCVKWAIFSDLYGVWFPDVKHEWYEKSPDKVTKHEFADLVKDFEDKLGGYDEICFYHNPRRFHHLYKSLLQSTKLKNVKKISHLADIT